MPDFAELRPGAYKSSGFDDSFSSRGDEFNPDPIAPQRFRKPLIEGDLKIVTPLSTFSGKFYPQKFSTAGKSAIPQGGKFKKGPLGEYEIEDVSGILQPSESLYPPQKRELSRREKIEDSIAQLFGGAGRGTAELLGFPRKMGELVNKGADVIPEDWLSMLPSEKDIRETARKNQRFMPLSPELLRRVEEGPMSAGGEYSGALGEYAPYTAAGAVPGLAKIVSKIFRLQSLMP